MINGVKNKNGYAKKMNVLNRIRKKKESMRYLKVPY